LASYIVPIMAYYPEPNLDYSLIGTDFTLVQTFLEAGSPVGEGVLRAAKQRLEAFFPAATVTYNTTTGKVSLTVSGIDRAKAEAFLDALRTDIKFAQIASSSI